MTTELPPPSGLFLHGMFLPFDEKAIELLLNISSHIAAETRLRDDLEFAKRTGNPDLFSFAQDHRTAQTETIAAVQNLVDWMRDHS